MYLFPKEIFYKIVSKKIALLVYQGQSKQFKVSCPELKRKSSPIQIFTHGITNC